MPAGKAAVLGGHGWIGPWPYAVNIRSMRRRAKQGTSVPTHHELKEYRKTLRTAVQIYRIDCVTPKRTVTERRKLLNKIKKVAQRFVVTPRGIWADRLLTYLYATDPTTRSVLRRHLKVKGHDWVSLKKGLRDVFAVSASPDESLPAVSELGEIDVRALVPAGGRWPNPGLARLVTMLIPIWENVTGRTAGLVSVDKGSNKKNSPFADWLRDMHTTMDLPVPSVGRIVDIVQAQKTKNPAHVTG